MSCFFGNAFVEPDFKTFHYIERGIFLISSLIFAFKFSIVGGFAGKLFPLDTPIEKNRRVPSLATEQAMPPLIEISLEGNTFFRILIGFEAVCADVIY